MIHTMLIVILFNCALLIGEQMKLIAERKSIQAGLSQGQIEAVVRDIVRDSSNAYVDLGIKDESREGLGMSTDPPLSLCIKFYDWAFGFSRAIYAKSDQGSVLYKWDGETRRGEWTILSGINPLYSEDQEIIVSEIITDGYGPIFRFISRRPDSAEETRRKAIVLARSFTRESAWIELRTDYFWWPGDCGGAGPQAFEFLRPAAKAQIVDTTERCILDKDSSTCIWQVVPNRRSKLPAKRGQ